MLRPTRSPACALALLALAAGGSDAPEGPSRAERAIRRAPVVQGRAAISADDDFFVPIVVKVRAGNEIVFTNDGRRVHNVIPLDGGRFRIDTDELRPGMSKAVQIPRAGAYRYFCSIHGTATRGMRGTIAVVR